MGLNISKVIRAPESEGMPVPRPPSDPGASGVFELSAQNGEKRFHVHKDVLISQSEPFRHAITGGWRETTERKINLNDWDGETVGRLVSFLHTGDYQYPDPVPSAGRAVVERRVYRKFKPSPVKPRTDPSRPLTPLDECMGDFVLQDRGSEADWRRLERFGPQDDYKELLLSHASVYSLAQYKSVNVLRILALRRISLILLKIDPLAAQPDSHTVLGFIELVNYVYSNTDSLVNSEEPLRKLVSQFAALNLQALQTRQEMLDLMSDGGDFVNDIMPKICRRLVVSQKSPETIRRPNPRPNPIIGSFNTGEVHHWRHPWPQTSKIVSFGTTYTTPIGLPVGINTMDIGNNGNIRINAYTSNVGRDRFTINIDSWLDTRIYSAGCSWLQILNDDPNFQFGRYSTREDHPHHQTRTSRLITFPRSYAAPPTVVVMLVGLDMQHNRSWRVRTYVTNVTATNFIIHIDTWDNTILHSAAATWIAYPTGLPKVASGTFNTQDVRPLHPAQLNTVGHVSFNHGVFATRPHALLAFNSLDIDCRRNMRVRLDYSNMTTAGMTWHISGWGNTIVYSAGGSYIALA